MKCLSGAVSRYSASETSNGRLGVGSFGAARIEDSSDGGRNREVKRREGGRVLTGY